MTTTIDSDTRLLASIAYGEASTDNDSQEIGGIAFAVANRCRAWNGKTVSELKAADPNYAYAWNGKNARFNELFEASESDIKKDAGMSLAVNWAEKAIKNEGGDPSHGALFWDGLDFKVDKNRSDNVNHPKRRDGFKYGDSSHNIFDVPEKRSEIIVRWIIKNKKTGRNVDGAERGRYDAVWVSTSAHGKTIFWKHPEDYLKATGGKEYR
ncbi:hypothetical protein [Thauera sinica]|uniref:Uncharacterized protein n=1 Tax=Thauera sinica TaxID=2665146 RepID=A0ABW1AYV4_9RHOO|nr:hypothetical protein [Thauera sp. K11]ATE58631.1 hypothetical protein CCZ27_00430 [Thauera sp. K11]